MQRTLRLLFLASLTGTGFAASVRANPATPLSAAREPQISGDGPAGDYLKRVHTRIHARWTRAEHDSAASSASSLAQPDAPTAKLDPSGSTRQVTVAVSIRWDGTIAELTLDSGSGDSNFDHHASEVMRQSGPFPLPPQDVVSDDDYAHVEWTFARDYRACGAGARTARVEDPLDVSLPRLIDSHRVPEAVRRVGVAVNRGAPDAMDRFARLFLARSIPDPILDVGASLALAGSGDRTQIARLTEALGSRVTAAPAALGLHRLGIDVCTALRPTLQSGQRVPREVAFETIRAEGRAGSDLSACRESLTTLLGDAQQPLAMRLLALDTVVTYLPAAAKPVLALAVRDVQPAIRGAAILASVRRGGGRPEMYRLAPLLRDRAVEVRAAASAGMVRAAGDQALDQLYLLARETDPRPAQAVSAELSQLTSAASAEFLGKMLKKSNPAVQIAATRALARRQDGAARAQLAASSAELPAEARALALASAGVHPGVPPAPTAAVAVANSGEPVAEEQVARLLRENHPRDAASWIVGHWATLPPSEAIAVLGTWLARPAVPAVTATAPKPSPASTANALSDSAH
jgi:TonB family protein